MDREHLSPAQRAVVEDLMDLGGDRPTFRADLAEDLRATLESELADLFETPPARPLIVKKDDLSRIHSCESYFQAASFPGWNHRTAAGTVVHKALQLSVSSPELLPPLVLVDHALESLRADDRSLSEWLNEASPLEVGELRGAANDRIAKFFECWPPLRRKWTPRPESRIGASLFGERLQLQGRVDLALGVHDGMQARVLIVDLKTGRHYTTHIEELRFYALVQTLRIGVPPFRIASYYLDTATFHAEDVTEDLLFSAARRVVDGVRKIIEISGARAPSVTEGPQCRWCRLQATCEGAARWEAARDAYDE